MQTCRGSFSGSKGLWAKLYVLGWCLDATSLARRFEGSGWIVRHIPDPPLVLLARNIPENPAIRNGTGVYLSVTRLQLVTQREPRSTAVYAPVFDGSGTERVRPYAVSM